MPGSKLSVSEHNPHQEAPLVRNQAMKRELVESHGSKDQKERYYVGLLPETELLSLARDVLFAPLAELPRYDKITAADVKHGPHCKNGGAGVIIKFFTRPPDHGIDRDEWTDYRRIQDILEEAWRSMPSGTHAKVDIIEHVGLCTFCHHRETVSRAASVRIEWAGHELVREYALGDD